MFRGGDDLRIGLGISAKLIPVIESADLLYRRFSLIAVQQIERDERVFQLREWCPGADGIDAEALKTRRTNVEDAIQLIRGVSPVIPQVRVWMRAAQRTRVFIGDEDKPRLLGVGENFVEGSGVFMRLALSIELAVSVINGDLSQMPMLTP